jgi:hypothetical protein
MKTILTSVVIAASLVVGLATASATPTKGKFDYFAEQARNGG